MNTISSATSSKIGTAVFILMLVVAIGSEFLPKEEPGRAQLLEAQALIAGTPGQDDARKACGLLRDALTLGNREAALGLAACIGRSVAGTESARRTLQYSVLLLGLESGENGEKCRRAIDELGATEQEIRAAREIDVLSVLKLEFMPDSGILQK